MMRFNALLIASILLIGGIAGCNQEEPSEPVVSTPQIKRRNTPKAAAPNAQATASPAASPGASPAASPATGKTAVAPASTAKAKAKTNTAAKTNDGAKATLVKLNGYLPAAVKALQANDIAKAKEYAKGFSDNWQQKIIQFQVKNKSQADYNKLAAAVTQVTNTVIKPANPDKTQAIASLQSLSQAVTQYAKSP